MKKEPGKKLNERANHNFSSQRGGLECELISDRTITSKLVQIWAIGKTKVIQLFLLRGLSVKNLMSWFDMWY